MTTIVFASSKGGVGKSTSALILATTLAAQSSVALIDADPNKPLKRWAARGWAGGRGGVVNNLKVISGVGEVGDEPLTKSNIMRTIREAAAQHQFVIVDLEGTASSLSGYAIALADLVVAPLAASQIEVDEAERVLELIAEQEEVTGRTIPFRVLFTRTPGAIRTRGMADIQKAMDEAGLPSLTTHLHDREAFRVLFKFGGTLDNPELTTVVSNVEKARLNARSYAQEVVNVLKEVTQ